jgi:ssDNA-binding Zn-finger/Zn-ribbon topoisomerase 1
MERTMIEYNMKSDYELIAKHCPKCESLVLAQVVRTLEGEFYKYREFKCSKCEWKSPDSC